MDDALYIRLLGEPVLLLKGRPLVLPPSKKTRALLAYLALSGRAHRRAQLCSLLWDVADDPRAALRWSLSKLRELVDTPEQKRLIANRELVELDRTNLRVDALEAKQLLRGPLDEIDTQTLERALELFRGELLEGLDLPDFQSYYAFCLAERESFRRLHTGMLLTLLARFRAQPQRALPLARRLVELDPLNNDARAQLMELLHRSGRTREAEDEARTNQRLLPAQRARRDGREPAPRESQIELPRRLELGPRLVGREDELARVTRTLRATHAALRVVLIEAEAGVGKTRLLQSAMACVPELLVFEGAALEPTPGLPYTPWLSLLRGSLQSVDDGELSGLLLELSVAPSELPEQGVRERLFQGVGRFIERTLARQDTLAIVLDDVHWLDAGSVALLQHVLDTCAAQPLSVLLAARPGALADNPDLLRVLRALRRRAVLEEINLAPLTPLETGELLRGVASTADPEQVYRESAGNPLFALELARAPARSDQNVPISITRVVRDRLASVPGEVADLLRWASVLGTRFDPALLDRLLALDAESFVSALEQLERHGWLRLEVTSASFSHEIVRSAIYDGLSGPRRQLMHMKVARALSEDVDPVGLRAAELARHAALAGDSAMAARACVAAGKRSLRLGASSDTHALARMGLSYVASLSEPERTTLRIELLDLSVVSRRPEAEAEVAQELSALATRALELGAVDHARRAMFLRVLLNWEDGHSADAQRFAREVERISRLGGARERVSGLGDAARCLASLERDLPEAEALLLEAEGIAESCQLEAASVALGRASVHVYRGQLPEAKRALARALELSRSEGDRLSEMHALEESFGVYFCQGELTRAEQVSSELLALGERSRAGSEIPFAHAARELCRYAADGGASPDALEQALRVLERADAKRRCALLLGHAAEISFSRGLFETARTQAGRALNAARALQRDSDAALALSVLVQVAELSGDALELERTLSALREVSARPLPARAKQSARLALGRLATSPKQEEKEHGARLRRTRLR